MMDDWTEQSPYVTLEAYDLLAEHYDAYTATDDYDRWANLITDQLALATTPVNNVFDVATGTGKVASALVRRNFRVSACDQSPSMLDVASRKGDMRTVRLLEADMRELPQVGPFDLVTCIDDAINYLLAEEDLLAAFSSAARVLRPGGLYIFDVNSLRTYRTAFAGTSAHESEEALFVWTGNAARSLQPGSPASARLDIFTAADEDSWKRRVSLHRQRHHPQSVLEQLLSVAGLDTLATLGLHSDGKVDKVFDDLVHVKALYVVRRGTEAPIKKGGGK